MELWTRLGDWLDETFLPDGTEPGGNGGLFEPHGRRHITPEDTSFIDPNGLPHTLADGTPSSNPNG